VKGVMIYTGSESITYKWCTLVYNCLHGTVPCYVQAKEHKMPKLIVFSSKMLHLNFSQFCNVGISLHTVGQIQNWKNYWNQCTFAKVIVKIKMARFYGPQCILIQHFPSIY